MGKYTLEANRENHDSELDLPCNFLIYSIQGQLDFKKKCFVGKIWQNSISKTQFKKHKH